MSYSKELDIARKAALKAGEIHRASRSAIKNIVLKDDLSPVTEVDKKCEALIREMLLKNFPGDGFLGEETGHEKGSSGRTWIVDPLDGTRPYIRNIPTYSALIALEEDGSLAVGVMHISAMDETYYAQRGGGAFCNGEHIRVSSTDTLSRALGSSLGFVEKAESPESACLLRLMSSWDYTYGFMDAYTYGCIASGKIDACVNLLDRSWDCAAAACIIKEAGGRFSDISGRENIHNGSSVITNGIIHDSVLSYFSELHS